MKLKRFAELNEAKEDNSRKPITFEYIKECVIEQLSHRFDDEFLQINIVQDKIEEMVEDKMYDIDQELAELSDSGLYGRLQDELHDMKDTIGD